MSSQNIWVKASGTDWKWKLLFVVVDTIGAVKVFENESMKKLVASSDLRMWSENDMLKSTDLSTKYAHRLTIRTQEFAMDFGFENEKQRDLWLSQFESLIEAINLSDVVDVIMTQGVIRQYVDEKMTKIRREIPLDFVQMDGVQMVGDRVVVTAKGGEERYEFTVKDCVERESLVLNIKGAISFMEAMRMADDAKGTY